MGRNLRRSGEEGAVEMGSLDMENGRWDNVTIVGEERRKKKKKKREPPLATIDHHPRPRRMQHYSRT